MAARIKERDVAANGRGGAAGGGTPMDAPAFEVHVRGVTQRVRTALADVLASVGADSTKPQSISKQLGLDKSLAWKAARIVTEADPFAAIPRLPGRSGVRILISSLEVAGAPAAMVQEFREAMEAFDAMVDTHAGSRETLQMMLASVSPEGQRERDEVHRKLAYEGNRAIWGVQARVHLGVHLLAPASARAGWLDTGTISALVDFRRLRPQVPWSVAQMHLFDDQGRPTPPSGYEPIDSRVGSSEPPVMRDFCSASLPPLRMQQTNRGTTRIQVSEGRVGLTGTATCVMGWMHRTSVPMHATPQDSVGDLIVHVNTPAELLIHDLVVHRSLDIARTAKALVYSQIPGEPCYPVDGRELGTLPVEGEMLDLGDGLINLMTPEVPRHRAMLEMGAARMGHPLSEFRGLRLKLAFPVVPTTCVFRIDLLPA
jgi:hypothetical protein